MPPNATSNHDLKIATTGSGHLAIAPFDQNLIPPKPKMQIFMATNICPTSHLKTGRTTKSDASGKWIWTARGILDGGSPISGPPHPGVDGGVFGPGFPYLKETKPTSYSPDAKIEAGFVVRTDDQTIQNHQNVKGKVVETIQVGDVEGSQTDKNKRCQIVEVKGYCKHGRMLSAPANKNTADGFSLDVVHDDKVTLIATRRIVADSLPKCALHTEWTVQRTGEAKDKAKTTVADTLDVDGAFLSHPFDSKMAGLVPRPVQANSAGTLAKPGEGPSDAEWRGVLNSNARQPQTTTLANPPNMYNYQSTSSSTSRFGTTTGQSTTNMSNAANGSYQQVTSNDGKITTRQVTVGGQQYQTQAANDPRTAELKKAAAKEAVQSADKLLELLAAYKAPPTVSVIGKGCAGAKNVTLRVFPEKKYTFDIGTMVKPWMQKVEGFGFVFKSLSERVGQKFEFEFCKEPLMQFECQLKELIKDKAPYFQSQVRPAWTLTLGIKPLLKVSYTWTLPILTFVGPFGRAAAWALEKAGIVADIRAVCSLEVTGSASGTYDQHGEGSLSGSAAITLTFSIGLVLEFSPRGSGGSASASVEAYVKGVVDINNFHRPPNSVIACQVSGYVQLGIKGAAKADLWGFWEPSADFDYAPPEWKWPESARPTKLEFSLNA